MINSLGDDTCADCRVICRTARITRRRELTFHFEPPDHRRSLCIRWFGEIVCALELGWLSSATLAHPLLAHRLPLARHLMAEGVPGGRSLAKSAMR
jgi:hypothetical protein